MSSIRRWCRSDLTSSSPTGVYACVRVCVRERAREGECACVCCMFSICRLRCSDLTSSAPRCVCVCERESVCVYCMSSIDRYAAVTSLVVAKQVFVCVCVCVWERERESVCVCVYCMSSIRRRCRSDLASSSPRCVCVWERERECVCVLYVLD